MPYSSSTGTDTTHPDGSVVVANQIDDVIRDLKTAYNERLDDILGTDFESEDPVVIKTLKLNGQANTKVLIGTADTAFRDDADTTDVFRLSNTEIWCNRPVYFGGGSFVSAGLHSNHRHVQNGGTIYWTNGNVQRCTITANTTISFFNAIVGAVLILEVLQDAFGGHTVTFSSAIKWGGDTAPTVSNTPNRKDVFGFLCVATNSYLGFVLDQNFSETS